jgi:hypothetical protein
MAVGCKCSVERGFECKNPKVSVPLCVSTLSLFLAVIYSIPLLIGYQRLDKWQTTTCTIVDTLMRQRGCTVSVCPSATPAVAGSPAACTSVTTMCFTCQYLVSMESPDGQRVLLYSDFDGNWKDRMDAAENCQQRMLASQDEPIACYYQPDIPSGNRLYVALTPPSGLASSLPLYIFSVTFFLGTVFLICCHCATAKPDAEWQRQLNLARERAADRHMRASRWSDYFGPMDNDPLEQMRAAVVPPRVDFVQNPMHGGQS